MYVTVTLIVLVIMIFITLIGIYREFKGEYDLTMGLIALGILGILFCWIPSFVLYQVYEVPAINLQAHNNCIAQGFDTFEKWDAPGFFPTHYTYVKCKYVDNRRDIRGELNIN